MYVLNKTADYNSFIKCTDDECYDKIVFTKNLLLSIPSSAILLSLIGL